MAVIHDDDTQSSANPKRFQICLINLILLKYNLFVLKMCFGRSRPEYGLDHFAFRMGFYFDVVDRLVSFWIALAV